MDFARILEGSMHNRWIVFHETERTEPSRSAYFGISNFASTRRERRKRHVDELDRDDLSSYRRSKEKSHGIAGKRIPAISRRNSDDIEQTKLPKREHSLFFIDSFSMSCLYSSFQTLGYALPSPVHIPKSLVSPILTSISPLNSGKVGAPVYWKIVLKPVRKRSLEVRASKSDDTGTEKWLKWLPNGALAADKILRLIASATASPISQFVSSPVTFLHSVDPRIKLVWLLALVVLPARSNITIRFGLVIFLAVLSIWILPTELWKDQLGRVSILSGILFVMLGLGADGVPPLIQSRTPPPGMMGLPELPASLGGYSYLIAKLGPLTFTRKGLSIASTSACLTFVVFQSASLCLTTTAPEQLAFAIRWFMLPLGYFGVPVAEITLTLLLSLRFVSLVFDEVRNVALGIVSRRINWQMLTTMETVDGKHPVFSRGTSGSGASFSPFKFTVQFLHDLKHFIIESIETSSMIFNVIFFTYLRRIFKNIFSHAEQISQAMIVRGFRGDSSSHKLYFLSNSSSRMANILSLLCLIGVISASVFFDKVIV
ncbi:hypothetical protein IC582_026919 [Cucumis melo]